LYHQTVNRKQKNKLGLKLVIYYISMVVLITLLIRLFPEVLPLLPFGGLDELQEGNDIVTETDVVNLVTYVQVPLDLLADGIRVTLSMLGALLLMVPIRWVYLSVGDLEVAEEEQPVVHKVSASLLLLPLVVTAIIVIVKFSLALAFALTGIFAGVRYRTSLKNLTDALFVFVSMAVGLAAGTQALGIALALSLFFVFTALVLEPLATDDAPPHNQADGD